MILLTPDNAWRLRCSASLPPEACRARWDAHYQRGKQLHYRRFLCEAAASGQLTDWVTQSKITTDSLSLAKFDGERGLRADQDIPAYQTLVSVPVSCILKAYPFQPDPFPEFCPKGLWSEGPWYFKLGLQIVHQNRLGKKSSLYPYLAELPQSFDSMPLQWTQEEVKELHYPCLAVMVATQREVYEVLHRNLLESHEKGITKEKPPTWEELCWGIQVARSRAFGGPFPGSSTAERIRTLGVLATCAIASFLLLHLPFEQVANGFLAAAVFNLLYDFALSRSVQWHTVCPIIDFMNHKTGTPSEVAYEYFGDRMAARCSIPFTEGEQVFLTYGDQSNDSLLQFYGFIDQDSPLDIYVLQDFLPRALAAASALSLPLAKAPKRPEGEQFDARLTRNGPDADVLQLLCGLLGLTLRPETHQPAYQVMAHVCQEEADSWPTTLLEDRELLKSTRSKKRHSARFLLAVRFRIEKKTVLAECLKSYMRQANQQTYAAESPSKQVA